MWRWQRASQHSSPEASAGPAVLPAPDGSHSAPAGRGAKESPVPAVAAAWTEACSPVPTPTPTPTTLTGLCGAARGRGQCAITSAVGKPWGWTAGGPRGTQGGVQPPARKEHVRWRWGGFSRVEAGCQFAERGSHRESRTRGLSVKTQAAWASQRTDPKGIQPGRRKEDCLPMTGSRV